MLDVVIAYLQFLYMQVSENALAFALVFLGVPVLWLLCKLTHIIDDESLALKLGAFVFFVCSVVSTALFVTKPDVQDYHNSLLWLCAGIITFLIVSPIFCKNPSFSFLRKKKQIILDGITYEYDKMMQISFKRCFTRVKPSCLVEFFFKDTTGKHRSLYFDTNDVKLVREIVPVAQRTCDVFFDCAFTRCTLEMKYFSLIIKALCSSFLLFCLIIPAYFEVQAKDSKVALPEYEIIPIPHEMYAPKEEMTPYSDAAEPIFGSSDIQVVLFYGPYSSHFPGNYRKALYGVKNQHYSFNLVFLSKHGLSLRRPGVAKEHLTVASEYAYTKFLVDNCKKLCFIDNSLKVMYTTNIDTIDPRIDNVKESINMYEFVQEKLAEQKELMTFNSTVMPSVTEERLEN